MSKSFIILISESHKLSSTPKALIETFTKCTALYEDDRENKGFIFIQLTFTVDLEITLKTNHKFNLLCKMRSSLNASQLFQLGVGSESRSA